MVQADSRRTYRSASAITVASPSLISISPATSMASQGSGPRPCLENNATSGKALVNATSGSPSRARAIQRWATEYGAE